MAVRGQQSSSSLSRDFCNSFWGANDAGVNIMFARMRGAAKTTGDLRNFWRERANIEEEYANRLIELSKQILGKDEIGELRGALDTLKFETGKLAASHIQLATTIRTDIEDSTAVLLNKQVEYHRSVQTPLEKRFKTKQAQDSYADKAREKYHTDCRRIASYTQQLEVGAPKDVERLQMKLQRAQQTVQANEQDFASYAQKAGDEAPIWEADWRGFCDGCQDLEEERLEFMKDNLWSYANAVSTVCVADDLSCEAIRTLLDQLEPERDIENFVNEYGTGNIIPDPPVFVPYTSAQDKPPAPASRPARFPRNSKRPATYPPEGSAQPTAVPEQREQQPPAPPKAVEKPPAPTNVGGGSSTRGGNPVVNGNTGVNGGGPAGLLVPPPPATPAPTKATNTTRMSMPLPDHPTGAVPFGGHEPMPSPSPLPPAAETGGVLFYVKALYDYTATIEEEFDFQAGDVIAVTATPDDGWWSGELLDEARREEGRHIFPSNFVCLF